MNRVKKYDAPFTKPEKLPLFEEWASRIVVLCLVAAAVACVAIPVGIMATLLAAARWLWYHV